MLFYRQGGGHTAAAARKRRCVPGRAGRACLHWRKGPQSHFDFAGEVVGILQLRPTDVVACLSRQDAPLISSILEPQHHSFRLLCRRGCGSPAATTCGRCGVFGGAGRGRAVESPRLQAPGATDCCMHCPFLLKLPEPGRGCAVASPRCRVALPPGGRHIGKFCSAKCLFSAYVQWRLRT